MINKDESSQSRGGSGKPDWPARWPACWPRYFGRGPEQRRYRSLRAAEIAVLEGNRNRSESWERVLVADGFRPEFVHDCSFHGAVRIGALSETLLEHEALRLPVGLELSGFRDCVLGDRVAIRRVGLLTGAIVGDGVLLFDIGELSATPAGRVQEPPGPLWLEVGNENGGRRLQACEELLPADACLWSRFRDDRTLLFRLGEIAARENARTGGTGCLVGDRSVITGCRLIQDVRIGAHAVVRGANELRNLTIQSSAGEPSRIGSGVELADGIVGFGNSIERGVKAIAFQTGRNVRLDNGARMLQSYLGANSTVSCCEILSNLILPFHEQHHNNSFLIASTILGQSNLSAGATIGSNHNSRAADGEILAGRGFWPGLCVSLKHNSRFASYTLLTTGLYAWEMDIRLPFSLVSPGGKDGGIRIFPAYWFRHNMYALERNARKFAARDRRRIKEQHIEFDYLAPDTASEMLAGLRLLEEALGREALREAGDEDPPLRLEGFAARRPALILKPRQGCRLYRRMLVYYGARELKKALDRAGGEVLRRDVAGFVRGLCQDPPRVWHNLGGQLVPEEALQALLAGIRSGELASYADLHAAYDSAWEAYPEQKAAHAIACLCEAGGRDPRTIDAAAVKEILVESVATAQSLYQAAFSSRRKDYENPFRAVTYRGKEELSQVLGELSENAFLNSFHLETEKYCQETRWLVEAIGRGKER